MYKGFLLGWAMLGGPLTGGIVRAQHPATAAADSSLAAAMLDMRGRYQAALHGHLGLYSGLQYGSHLTARMIGHPYFGADTEPWTGRVDYDGQPYAGVPLWYDLILDALVTRRFDSPAQLRLVGDRVTAFQLGAHRFVRLPAGGSAPAGFYEELFAAGDSLRVLARHSKHLYDLPNDREGHREFRSRQQLYVLRAGRYYPVAKLSSVLKALGGHRQELKKLAATRHLRFDDGHRAASTAALAAEYSRLTAAPAITR